MHKPESATQNDMHKILWDFAIQMEYLIPIRKPDLVLINKKKKNLQSSVPANHCVEIKESHKIRQILRPC